jgi:hypothetical protein
LENRPLSPDPLSPAKLEKGGFLACRETLFPWDLQGRTGVNATLKILAHVQKE